MHRALRYLLLLQYRAAVRKRLARAKGVRGAMMTLLGVGVLCICALPYATLRAYIVPAAPSYVCAVLPIMMIAMWVFQIAGSVYKWTVYFSPGEVNLLFAGPFGRRGLLLYRFGLALPDLLFEALLSSLLFGLFATFWLAAFVALFLAMVFIHLLSMAFCLVASTVAESADTRLRRIAIIAGLIVLAVGALQAFSPTLDTDLTQLIRAMGDSWVMQCLLVPLTPFARAFAATSLLPDLVVWAGVCLAFNAVLMLLVLQLDANYIGVADAVGQRVLRRTQRARRSALTSTLSKSTGRMLPILPHMGGVGPVAWRQMTNALRCLPKLLLVVVVVSVNFGGLLAVYWTVSSGALAVICCLPPLTIMLTTMVQLDFRSELACMDTLKTLPVRPMAIAFGELVVPVIVTTMIQALWLVSLSIAMKGGWLVLILLLVAPPLNLLLLAVDNTMFLLHPTVQVGKATDLHFVGHHVLTMLAKAFVTFVSLGLAAAAGLLTYITCLDAPITFGLIAWIVLMAEAMVGLLVVAKAYACFDPSTAPSV